MNEGNETKRIKKIRADYQKKLRIDLGLREQRFNELRKDKQTRLFP